MGQTGQNVMKRMGQYRRDCRVYLLIDIGETDLSEHHFLAGHERDSDNVTVLDREKNRKKC